LKDKLALHRTLYRLRLDRGNADRKRLVREKRRQNKLDREQRRQNKIRQRKTQTE